MRVCKIMLSEHYTPPINSLFIYLNELGDIGKKTRDIMVILPHNPNTYITYSLSFGYSVVNNCS